MNEDLERVIEIPEGIEVVINGNDFSVKGNGKETSRNFDIGRVHTNAKDGKIILVAKGATRRESKMIGTTWAHLKNMVKGVGEEFVYELEICNVHFPMNVSVHKAQQLAVSSEQLAVGKGDGDKIIIKSFLGETTERVSKILPNVDVEIKGNIITVSSHDIEAAGQTAANLEKATRLIGRDRRIFQDGIYITEKPGRKI